MFEHYHQRRYYEILLKYQPMQVQYICLIAESMKREPHEAIVNEQVLGSKVDLL